MPDDYLLGHDEREWSRLAEQHALWGPVLIDEITALGVGSGARVLELGCGSGRLLADLAALVGPDGQVEGLERDEAAARLAEQQSGGRVRVGDLRDADLGGPWDAIVARWVLSFVDDVPGALARCLGALKPGGHLIVQDYNHDGLGIWPMRTEVERLVSAIRTAYAARGGDLWVAAQLPGLLAAAGATDVAVTPHAKAGRPGDATWRWFERFALEHVRTFVDDEHLTVEEAEAFEEAWSDVVADPGAVFFSPLVVTVTARRPVP